MSNHSSTPEMKSRFRPNRLLAAAIMVASQASHAQAVASNPPTYASTPCLTSGSLEADLSSAGISLSRPPFGNTLYRTFGGADPASAVGQGSTAVGIGSTTIGQDSFAAGLGSLALGRFSFAAGYCATAGGFQSVAINGSAAGQQALALNGTADGERSIAINGSATGLNSIAVGGVALAA